MERKVLPIGVRSFRKVREKGYYYVDKTSFANKLIREGKPYFLSRPRQFGKSMFVSMLKELFEGNRKLFEGLAIHNDWEWSTTYPVVLLDFNEGDFSKPKYLKKHVINQIKRVEQIYGIEPPDTEKDAMERLSCLFVSLYEKTGKEVVYLVDGYDRPVLDVLHLPKVARKNMNRLHEIYSNVKSHDDEIEFSFFTGSTKLSIREKFLGPDHLIDITFDSDYSEICGYTEANLDSVFAPELDGINRQKIREWYKGYNWLGGESVYNPYDILNLLQSREFKPWWFESESPELQMKALRKRRVMSIELDSMKVRRGWRGWLNIDNFSPADLLFQTGYLTITEVNRVADRTKYKLDYPNRGVRQHFNQLLLDEILPDTSQYYLSKSDHLQNMLSTCDVEGMKNLLQSVLASIPYQWHMSTNIPKLEARVASAFYSYFMGAGLHVRVENSIGEERIALAVTGPSSVYLFEFKAVDKAPSGETLKNVKEKGYAQKYRGLGKSVYLAGVEFSSRERNIVGFEVVPDGGGSSRDMQYTVPAAATGPSP